MYTIIICILAGIGAGVGTGFAGISAAAFIAPMLLTFLGMPAYESITISLLSDILASAASSRTYAKNKNIDLKNGKYLMIPILGFTIVGSFAGSYMPDQVLGMFSVVMTVIMGFNFVFKKEASGKNLIPGATPRVIKLESLASGIYIGFVCGFMGAGGGMMMLVVLTVILGYELKTAVGTSTFIMAFTAAVGGISHIALGGFPQVLPLVLCAIVTFVVALGCAKVAIHLKPRVLNLTTGLSLLVIGIIMVLIKFGILHG